nr:minor capsid protein [Pseudomonas nitroreducens]
MVEASTRNQVFLERLKSGEVEKIAPYLVEVDRAIRLELSKDSLTSYSRQRFEKLLTAIDGIILAIYQRYIDVVEFDLVDLAQYEASFEARSLNQVLVNTVAVVPTTEAVRAAVFSQPLQVTGVDAGKLLDPFLKDWTVTETQRVLGAIRVGYTQGKTNQQIIQQIRGTKSNQYKDGILATTQRDAEAVVRTAVQHTAMTARMETLKTNSNVVTGYEWVSTLDSRTTPQCRSLDGRIFQVGEGPVPPIHIRCRSSIAPTLNARFDFLKEGATRASKDGQVDASLTYYEWLKTQSAAFQDAAMGPTRGQLFRSGGLSAERFAELQLDRNFKPLTLDEMRRLEPLAFERAGI